MTEGILFVVSGPSGAGKGTVLKEVFKRTDNLSFSVSATTRAPRPNEIDGVHYNFIGNEEFDKMIENGEMLEYVAKFTNRYGTPKKTVENALKSGKDIVLEIETIGAENVRKLMPECVSIFIAPPSLKELWNRLSGRQTETAANGLLRFETSKTELECAYGYDYVVINDKLDECIEKVVSIIAAERAKVARNKEIIGKILNN